jgi:hypothetical protein
MDIAAHHWVSHDDTALREPSRSARTTTTDTALVAPYQACVPDAGDTETEELSPDDIATLEVS